MWEDCFQSLHMTTQFFIGIIDHMILLIHCHHHFGQVISEVVENAPALESGRVEQRSRGLRSIVSACNTFG